MRRALRHRYGHGRADKHSRLVLGRIARNAKTRSLSDTILTTQEHGGLWRLHTGLAEKYARLRDAQREELHRSFAADHLRGWLGGDHA